MRPALDSTETSFIREVSEMLKIKSQLDLLSASLLENALSKCKRQTVFKAGLGHKR